MKGQQGGRDCRQRRLPEPNFHNCLRKPPIAQFQFQAADGGKSPRIIGINRPCPGYSGIKPSTIFATRSHRQILTENRSVRPVCPAQNRSKTRVNSLKFAYARINSAGAENKFSSADMNVVVRTESAQNGASGPDGARKGPRAVERYLTLFLPRSGNHMNSRGCEPTDGQPQNQSGPCRAAQFVSRGPRVAPAAIHVQPRWGQKLTNTVKLRSPDLHHSSGLFF
jgi:hypothetical protein